MSAFVCSDEHINLLATFAEAHSASYYWDGRRIYARELGAREIAKKLHKANIESVNYRYGENSSTDDFKYKRVALANYSPVVVLKQCDCFDYQACEVDDYEKTEAAAIINGIRSYAINKLPGYDDAPWGI